MEGSAAAVVGATLETYMVPDIKDLPPMPKPDRGTMCRESLCGCALVVILATIFVGCVSALAQGESMPDLTAKILLGCIWAEAGVALGCLLGLLLGDAGTIRRTPETCYPMPDEVVSCIQKGTSLTSLCNINADDGRSYCVRCLVWRPAVGSGAYNYKYVYRCRGAQPHHCSICNRCVTHFDHHCGVFGRCIAGTCCIGNYKYFKLVIDMGKLGALTCVVAFVMSLAHQQQ